MNFMTADWLGKGGFPPAMSLGATVAFCAAGAGCSRPKTPGQMATPDAGVAQ
jgi:hypothetical protein